MSLARKVIREFLICFPNSDDLQEILCNAKVTISLTDNTSMLMHSQILISIYREIYEVAMIFFTYLNSSERKYLQI